MVMMTTTTTVYDEHDLFVGLYIVRSHTYMVNLGCTYSMLLYVDIDVFALAFDYGRLSWYCW
jgi:hypothetical protein